MIAEVMPGDKAIQVQALQTLRAKSLRLPVTGSMTPPRSCRQMWVSLWEQEQISPWKQQMWRSSKANLRSIAVALELSRATMRVIRQNLFWAFAYNTLLIPLAIASPAIPFLRQNAPIFAAAAMALSSVTVVSNSLRLRRFGLRNIARVSE